MQLKWNSNLQWVFFYQVMVRVLLFYCFFLNCLLRSLFRLSLWIFWKVKMTSTKARHVFSDRSVRLNPKRLLCKKTPVTQSYSRARTRSISNYYILQWGFVNLIFSAAFDSSFPFFPTSLSPLCHRLVDVTWQIWKAAMHTCTILWVNTKVAIRDRIPKLIFFFKFFSK